MSDAIIMTVESVRTRASTSEAIISFAVPLEQSALVSGFMAKIGTQVGAAFVDVDQYKRTPQGIYGKEARALRLSNFFRTPEVWKAIGTDEQFLDWLRGQPCAVCGDYDYVDGQQVCEAAHVRRVANGSGTGIKPAYSAIPLCHKHHAEQHQQGEGDKAWYDKQRIQHVIEWGWQSLKTQLECEHWNDVEPVQLSNWAKAHDLYDYLPREYRL